MAAYANAARTWARAAKRALAAGIVGSLSRFVSRHDSLPLPPPPAVGPVAEALRLELGRPEPIARSDALLSPFSFDELLSEETPDVAMFREGREWLPCVLDQDVGSDWFQAASYYPVYHRLYQRFHGQHGRIRFLELGVRTGYQGVVLVHASAGACFYVGVDPNLYVRDGLLRAASTFSALRTRNPDFDFALINGYSWNHDVAKSLVLSGPFDLIHIDADHSLRGKLFDLELASRLVSARGLVLVDDYDHHEVVREAVERALRAGWYAAYAYVPTLRGLAVLTKAS